MSDVSQNRAINGNDSHPLTLIAVDADLVSVDGLKFTNDDVADALEKMDPRERRDELVKMIEVGQHCLERASNGKDTDFVKRQLEKLVGTVIKKVGPIPETVQAELMKKIGVKDGQVLQPLMDSTEKASKTIKDQLVDMKTFVEEKLDLSKDSSAAGKVIKTLNDMLDPDRKDSVQGTLEDAIKNVTGEDGVLSKSVKSVVSESVKPLKEELDLLAKEIRGKEAAEQVVQETTKKGPSYEHKVVEELQPWAKATGAEVDHKGPDNKPGDVVVTLSNTSVCGVDLCLVIEARDRKDPKGRKAISDDMTTKMAERSANAGIYLTKTLAGLSKGIGDWAEGQSEHGPWVATTHEHLHTAVRFLIAMKRIAAMKKGSPEVDSALIESQVETVRTTLARIRTINTQVGKVKKSAEEIKTEADTLRDEIRESLNSIEEALRQSGDATK